MGHLHQQISNAAGGGMDESRLAAAERERVVDQVVGGHTLEQGSGGLLVGDAVGNVDQAINENGSVFRIGSLNSGPRNVIAGLHGSDFRTDGRDYAGSLLAKNEGQRNFVAALALIGVDEIDTAGADLHYRFIEFGLGGGQIDKLQDFRAAGLG